VTHSRKSGCCGVTFGVADGRDRDLYHRGRSFPGAADTRNGGGDRGSFLGEPIVFCFRRGKPAAGKIRDRSVSDWRGFCASGAPLPAMPALFSVVASSRQESSDRPARFVLSFS